MTTAAGLTRTGVSGKSYVISRYHSPFDIVACHLNMIICLLIALNPRFLTMLRASPLDSSLLRRAMVSRRDRSGPSDRMPWTGYKPIMLGIPEMACREVEGEWRIVILAAAA
jgi:hypothetical protein